MNIIVCIKQVPETTQVRLDPKTNTLIREGVACVINRDDQTGLEAALQLREQVGGSVTAVCMGPPQADVALREALAMGCDRAVLVSSREFSGSDTYATATILAAALGKLEFDLVITGRQAADGDTAQVGPQLAERLGIPQVSYVQAVAPWPDGLVVKRRFEDRHHVLKVKPPCLITVLSELAQPRYMHVGGTVDAYEKEIRVLTFDDLKDALNSDWIGLTGSPTRVVRTFPKATRQGADVRSGLSADEAAQAILAKLIERHMI